MTSLAKQLQRLAVPHTRAVLGEDKRKLSLLFDAKTAATIDRETFHSLGCNGLLELQNIDEAFHEFEGPLFGDASMSFERSTQTQDTNDKIDDIIRRFLIKLSPYCLLRPAHKALEWLIQRFYINYYNIDDLLMCFLPYHETKIFARVLQVVKFDAKLRSKWDFLASGQESGLHLPKKTLVKYCASNNGFLSFICDMVPKSVKVLAEDDKDVKKGRVLFSFFATTVIAVLDSGNVTEELIGMLLPHISGGMYSKVLDYKAASYMILSQVFYKAKLKTSILKGLQKVMGKSIIPELAGEAVACFMLMFQTQEVNFLKGHRYLCKDYYIIDSITELSSQFECGKFLSVLLEHLIPSAFKHAVNMATSGEDTSDTEGSRRQKAEYVSILHRLLSNMMLPADLAEQTAYNFLKVYVEHGKKYLEDEVDERVKDTLQGIVRQLEGKHSSEVDKAVGRMLKECNGKQEKDLVQEFLNLFVLSVPRQLVTDSETSLVLSLNHRLPVVREKAIATLVQNRQTVEDESFLKESLILRLKDDDPQVVKAALQIGKDIWEVIEEDKQTIDLLQRLLFLGLGDQKWSDAANLAADLLGSYSGSADHDAVTSIMPCFFLLSASATNLAVINSLLASKLAKQNSFLKTIAEGWHSKNKSKQTKEVSGKTLPDTCIYLVRCVAKALIDVVNMGKLDMVREWCEQALKMEDQKLSCLMLVALDNLVSMVKEYNDKLDVLIILLDLVDKLQGKVEKDGKTSVHFLESDWTVVVERNLHDLTENLLPVELFLKPLFTVVNTLTVPKTLTQGGVFWQYTGQETVNDRFLLLSVHLYDMLTSGALADGTGNVACKIYRHLIKLLEKTCFEKPEDYLRFLGLLWTQHVNSLAGSHRLTLYLQAKSLHLGLPHMQQLSNLKDMLINNPNVMVNLLFVLASPKADIRQCGQSYIRHFYDTCKGTESYFNCLLKKIVHCEGEIGSDETYITKVMHSLFKSTSPGTKPDTGTPRRKRTTSKDKDEGQTTDKDKMKATCLQTLMSIIVDKNTPYFVQHKLMDIFSQLNNEATLTYVLPLMERLLNMDPKERGVSRKPTLCLNLLIQRFTVESVGSLSASGKGLQLFVRALKLSGGPESVRSPQLTAISQISLELYCLIDDKAKHEILSTLFDVYLEAESLEVAEQIRKVFKHIQIDGTHIRDELQKCLKASSAKTVREAKRQKKVTVGDEDGMTEFDSKMWQRSTIALEAIQNKKKLTSHTEVAPVCFQLLTSILESDNHVSAEYLKQLILGVLQNICGRMEKAKDEGIVQEDEFNMDLIVNCIRSSDNPQTHHQALLLLTSAAKIYPEHLLHNMMSVFTFMGANTMRQDDAYSFQIISKLLETVVPALIMACEQRKHVPKGITNDLNDIITMVIQVFVDSYPHIPRHRRLVLFNKLLSVIGEGQYLWRTLLLMLETVVTKGTLKNELAADTQEAGVGGVRTDESDLDFCLILCAEFGVPVQLTAAKHMIQYIMKLPYDKDDHAVRQSRPAPQSFGKLRKDDAKLFNVDIHTAKQLRHFKYASIYLLVNLFSSPEFVMQVAASDQEEVMVNFRGVLEILLQFISGVTAVANKAKDKQSAKFWKAFLHKVYHLLDKLVSILPDGIFTEVICGLVMHELPTVQRKAMELMNTKLQQQKEISEKEATVLLPMVRQLCDIVEKMTSGDEMTDDELVNTQTAFITLKLLCRNIGHQNTDKFLKVLKISLTVFKNTEIRLPVSSCALLCVAEICQTLKVHTIPQLPHFMPLLVSVLGNHDNLLQNELYLMSVVTTVNKVVENLSNFLSPYLLKIIKNVCILCSRDIDVLQKQHVQQRLKAIRTTLSATLPTRVLLPAATSCYNQLIDDHIISVSSLLSLIGDHLAIITREDLNSHLTELQSFFIKCLDLRIDYPEVPEKETTEVEGVTIETIIAMVLKLSESSFKPFLFKLFEWATSNDDFRGRVLVFYRLADSLADRLRSLFTIFAGNIIPNAAKLLELNNSMKEEDQFFPSDSSDQRKTCELLNYILDCLTKCCLYDTEGFITKERFDTLLQPLIDQVENEYGNQEAYTVRVKDHLVPCIVQMTVASHDDSLWRSLNYQVCLKTRSSDPKVKDSALEILDQLHKKLGEEYMPLLPDTVPFLAELMEDESEEVEKKCQAVIRDMEKTLGEPLQKYF